MASVLDKISRIIRITGRIGTKMSQIVKNKNPCSDDITQQVPRALKKS